jgi:Tfp pilus assembly protein PilV
MTRRPGSHQRGEEGATLLLALIFVLLVSVIMLAIVNLSGTNILNTTNLQNERTLEYSAEGGVQAALQAVRYVTPSQSSGPSSYCSSSHTFFNGPQTLGMTPVVVACQVASLLYARAFTFEACRPATAASSCTNNANNADILRTTVLLSDVSAGCTGPIGPGCYNPVGAVAGSTSGASVTVESWIVERANG